MIRLLIETRGPQRRLLIYDMVGGAPIDMFPV